VSFGDVVDELENDNRLADTGTAERADFAALGERANQIDDLDAGLQNRCARVLISQLRRFAMDRVTLGKGNRTAIIDRITRDVKDAAKSPLAHRNGDRPARVVNGHAALQTFG
jgi:peptide chain release factor 1